MNIKAYSSASPLFTLFCPNFFFKIQTFQFTFSFISFDLFSCFFVPISHVLSTFPPHLFLPLLFYTFTPFTTSLSLHLYHPPSFCLSILMKEGLLHNCSKAIEVLGAQRLHSNLCAIFQEPGSAQNRIYHLLLCARLWLCVFISYGLSHLHADSNQQQTEEGKELKLEGNSDRIVCKRYTGVKVRCAVPLGHVCSNCKRKHVYINVFGRLLH